MSKLYLPTLLVLLTRTRTRTWDTFQRKSFKPDVLQIFFLIVAKLLLKYFRRNVCPFYVSKFGRKCNLEFNFIVICIQELTIFFSAKYYEWYH